MKSLQLDKPHAIITIGVQGSGKTFFAEKFSETFKAPYFEQSMFRHYAKDDKSADELFNRTLDETLKSGKSIVIELANASRVERAEVSKRVKTAGYIPLFVWVQIDAATAMNRTFRSQGTSQAEYMDYAKKFSPAHPTERALVISGKHTFATQAKAVLKKLTIPRDIASPSSERKQPTRGQIIVR